MNTIQITTDTNNENFKLIKFLTIGKKVRAVELIAGTKYANEGESVESVRIHFEGGFCMTISQIKEPIDDEDEHRPNPLEIEVTK